MFDLSGNFFLVFLTFCCLAFYWAHSSSKWRKIKTNWPWTFQLKFWWLYFHFYIVMTIFSFLRRNDLVEILLHVNYFITYKEKASCLLMNLTIPTNCLKNLNGYVNTVITNFFIFSVFVWKILIFIRRASI